MKYANVTLTSFEASDGTALFNIGDYMVMQGIENLYRFMGVQESEKIYISPNKLKDYDGEYAVLPINMIMSSRFFSSDDHFCISPKLFPVLLGATLEEKKWEHISGTFDFFKSHEPVGCRDDVALTTMREHGIQAYLGGCLSLTIPRRDKNIKGSTVFLVDIPRKLLNYIPEDIRKNSEIVTHYRYLEKTECTPENCINLARQQYLRYQKDARLVVTSRLHAALPCLAMGIPVILVRDYGAFTFSWVEKLIPFYKRKDYDKINWYPAPAEFEDLKKNLLLNASTRVRQEYEKHQLMYQISEYYENRTPRYRHYEECQDIYLQDLFDHLEKIWSKDAHIHYALWGVQSNAEAIYSYITQNFPNAKLVKVFDSWISYSFHGIQTSHPKEMTAKDDYYTIVIATNAVHAAQSLFQEIQKTPDQYYFVADSFVEAGESFNQRPSNIV